MSRRRRPSFYPPSTGELMDRAHLLARGLLYDAHQRDGRSMLRAWGEVVEGASELWRRLPERSDVPGTGHDVIGQLERSARTLHRSAGQAREVDPTLQEIGQVFTRAADLIDRSGIEERTLPARWTDAQLRDAFAARVNVMHTLYVASHAITVGLAETTINEKFDERLRVFSVSADQLRRRVVDVEQVAHSYISGHYPQALEGRHREPVDHSRIAGAIGTWDVHAQRVLTREPSADAMARVAESAFAASTHAHRLWRAAVETGHVDHGAFDYEIGPALETMIEKWGAAHTQWQRLSHPHDRSTLLLREAGWELVNAMREVTRDRVGPATAESIAQRVDMPSLVRSLHRFHATVAGVGEVFHETARGAPLLVNARPANEMATAVLDLDERRSPAQDQSVISPKDVLLKRAVPLPEGMRHFVEDPARQAASASRASLRATMAASDRRQDTMRVPASWTQPSQPETRLSRGQDQEQRHLAVVFGEASGPGTRR